MSDDNKETENQRIARLIKEAQAAFINPEPVTKGEQFDIFSNYKDPREYREEEDLKVKPRLSIINLGVSDLKRSEDFYVNVFGWLRNENSTELCTLFQLNGIILSLYVNEKSGDDVSVSSRDNRELRTAFTYCTRTEHEVDMLFNRFTGMGVKIVKTPSRISCDYYSGCISDPDGHLWEIAFISGLKIEDRETP